MKRFERSSGLDTALYKNYLYLFFYYEEEVQLGWTCGESKVQAISCRVKSRRNGHEEGQ